MSENINNEYIIKYNSELLLINKDDNPFEYFDIMFDNCDPEYYTCDISDYITTKEWSLLHKIYYSYKNNIPLQDDQQMKILMDFLFFVDKKFKTNELSIVHVDNSFDNYVTQIDEHDDINVSHMLENYRKVSPCISIESVYHFDKIECNSQSQSVYEVNFCNTKINTYASFKVLTQRKISKLTIKIDDLSVAYTHTQLELLMYLDNDYPDKNKSSKYYVYNLPIRKFYGDNFTIKLYFNINLDNNPVLVFRTSYSSQYERKRILDLEKSVCKNMHLKLEKRFRNMKLLYVVNTKCFDITGPTLSKQTFIIPHEIPIQYIFATVKYKDTEELVQNAIISMEIPLLNLKYNNWLFQEISTTSNSHKYMLISFTPSPKLMSSTLKFPKNSELIVNYKAPSSSLLEVHFIMMHSYLQQNFIL